MVGRLERAALRRGGRGGGEGRGGEGCDEAGGGRGGLHGQCEPCTAPTAPHVFTLVQLLARSTKPPKTAVHLQPNVIIPFKPANCCPLPPTHQTTAACLQWNQWQRLSASKARSLLSWALRWRPCVRPSNFTAPIQQRPQASGKSSDPTSL
jgi:hypothetical protein